MCAWMPRSESGPTARTRSIASGACAIAKPNFESAWPVEIFSWVSPRTSGVTRTSTGCSPPVGERALGDELLEALDLVEVVDHDRAHAMAHRHAQLRLRLRVAVEDDPLGLEAGDEREMQLAAGGHVAPQPLLGEQAQHRRAGEGLGGEDDVEVGVAGLAGRVEEGAGAGAQVLLGDDVGGRAELARELDRVAAADLEPPLLVEAAAERECA